MPIPTAPTVAEQVHWTPAHRWQNLRSSEPSPLDRLGDQRGKVFAYRVCHQAENLGRPHYYGGGGRDPPGPPGPANSHLDPLSPVSKVGASITALGDPPWDISSDAFDRRVDDGIAERAVQQLVYTATAAAANAGLSSSDNPLEVVILVDGHRGYEAFGHVSLGEPMSRDSSWPAPIWILDPAQGATFEARVEVFGRGVAFESQLRWQIYRIADAARRSPRASWSKPVRSPSMRRPDKSANSSSARSWTRAPTSSTSSMRTSAGGPKNGRTRTARSSRSSRPVATGQPWPSSRRGDDPAVPPPRPA